MKQVVLLAFAGVLITGVLHVDGVRAEPGQRRFGSEPMPRVGACFYDDVNFRGQYFCVGPREELDRMPPGMNDKISSMRLIGDVEVMVFKDERFKGPSGRFFNDVRDLRREGWNDQISSLRVAALSVRWDRDRAPVWGHETFPKEGACFYRNAGYRGDYFCVPRGASYPMVPAGFNDQISSIHIIGARGVLIFENRDFGGRVARIASDVPDLRRGVWNDKVSSLRVF
jgi:hypothetical protein